MLVYQRVYSNSWIVHVLCLFSMRALIAVSNTGPLNCIFAVSQDLPGLLIQSPLLDGYMKTSYSQLRKFHHFIILGMNPLCIPSGVIKQGLLETPPFSSMIFPARKLHG